MSCFGPQTALQRTIFNLYFFDHYYTKNENITLTYRKRNKRNDSRNLGGKKKDEEREREREIEKKKGKRKKKDRKIRKETDKDM